MSDGAEDTGYTVLNSVLASVQRFKFVCTGRRGATYYRRQQYSYLRLYCADMYDYSIDEARRFMPKTLCMYSPRSYYEWDVVCNLRYFKYKQHDN